MNELIIYHADCPDGFCAAYIAHKRFPEAEFIAGFYGELAPYVQGKKVYILDFSYKRDILIKMKAEAESLLVLDHHKTAAEDLKGLDFCIFDMQRSGAMLAYDYFTPRVVPSWLPEYVQDRDLWRWELASSREVSAAIASYPRTFKAWDEFLEKGLISLMLEGKAILRYKNQLISECVESAVELELAGHKILVANCGVRNLTSEVAGELAVGRPFGAVWWVAGGKKRWSLRSEEGGVDVSTIAKAHGGGGHVHAAGYEEMV